MDRLSNRCDKFDVKREDRRINNLLEGDEKLKVMAKPRKSTIKKLGYQNHQCPHCSC